LPAQVRLNSGDVLVFGGPARLMLHAVTKIHPRTAPRGLKMPQAGRLNLTFRQSD
jgi:alkylated DNA repair dioxygenase AlkB